jgi:hypothetical protein
MATAACDRLGYIGIRHKCKSKEAQNVKDVVVCYHYYIAVVVFR